MSYFEKEKQDIIKSNKDFLIVLIKPYIIISIISMLLAIYFLLIGYLDDREALILGYSSLFISFIVNLIILKYLSRIRKIKAEFLMKFESINDKGVLKYKIQKDVGIYTITLLNNGSVELIEEKNIRKIKSTKKYLFVCIYANKWFTFPNNESIKKMFKNVIK